MNLKKSWKILLQNRINFHWYKKYSKYYEGNNKSITQMCWQGVLRMNQNQNGLEIFF